MPNESLDREARPGTLDDVILNLERHIAGGHWDTTTSLWAATVLRHLRERHPHLGTEARDVAPRPRQLARLFIDTEVLLSALHLPQSVRIVDAEFRPHSLGFCQVQLELEGNPFPPVAPGAPIPQLRVVLRQHEDGRVTLDKMELRDAPIGDCG